MSSDTNVVSILSNVLGEVLVYGNTATRQHGMLQVLQRNSAFLITHEMGNERKEIDCSLLVTNIVNLDLGLWYSTAIPSLDVRLVLILSLTQIENLICGGLEFWLILFM